jgi:hypothetical protein
MTKTEDKFLDLKTLYEEIVELSKSTRNINAKNSFVINSACLCALQNIDLFQFGAKGGINNHSYVDFMNIAIRRQIELSQRLTLPLINTSFCLNELSNPNLKLKSKYEEINNYWIKELGCDKSIVGKIKIIKNIASDYVHQIHMFKMPDAKDNVVNIYNAAQYIYNGGGSKKEYVGSFINSINPNPPQEVKKELESRIAKLFLYDLNRICLFTCIFRDIMSKLKKYLS